MRRNLVCTLFLLPLTSYASEVDPQCQKWFDTAKIEISSRDCESNCVVLKTDMGTFICPEQCASLCRGKSGQVSLTEILYYPGLTAAEKKIIEKYPQEALIVFIQMERAEFSQARNFPEGKFNDESDAFRHYVWAGLITKAIGAQKSKEFLDAHEENPIQPLAEKSMDLANNRAGILAAEALVEAKQFSLKRLEAKSLDELRKGQLIVIKPGLSVPKEPK